MSTPLRCRGKAGRRPRSGMGLAKFLSRINCYAIFYIFMPKCQNISQKNLFTATKHSGVKNGRFGALGRRCPMKKRAANDEDLHIGPTFVQLFRSNFAAFRVFVSTPNFQKSTPNFQKSLTFFSQRSPNFAKFRPTC